MHWKVTQLTPNSQPSTTRALQMAARLIDSTTPAASDLLAIVRLTGAETPPRKQKHLALETAAGPLLRRPEIAAEHRPQVLHQ